MKPKQRQAAILEYLRQHGKTLVETLAEHYSTTGTTIRKDLVTLEHEGMVIRTYGGVLLSSEEIEQSIDHKTHINSGIKARIAKVASSMVREGDSLVIDAGSTVLQMVPFLSKLDSVTIMTNSLHIMNELASFNNNQTLLMPGGTLRKKSASFHGGLAESAFEKFSFDKLFMGADGVDLSMGITTFNEVHNVSTAMCKAASQIILLVDSSKFGRKSPNVVCKLEQVDVVITDSGIPADIHQALLDMAIKVFIVGDRDE